MEKYDKKLDELKEEDDLKEVEILSLQKQLGNDVWYSALPKDGLPEKIDFLQSMIVKLRKMNDENTQEVDSRDAICGEVRDSHNTDTYNTDGRRVYRERRKTSPLSSVLSSI